MTSTDSNKATALILLDYTKAFDRLNHSLFLAILHYYGFKSPALHLVGNYLAGRKQYVKLNGRMSSARNVECGVPQGSILGPLFFTIYTAHLMSCIKQCSIHFYADDTQLYLSFDIKDVADANLKINNDLSSLMKMSKAHCLSINPEKSKIPNAFWEEKNT